MLKALGEARYEDIDFRIRSASGSMLSALIAGTAATVPSMNRPIARSRLRLASIFITSSLGISRPSGIE
jgi:hypothetical protein